MARRIAIGVAWWLAVAYGFQMGAFMFGLPLGVGPVLAVPLAVLVAIAVRPRVREPNDRRRIFQPRPDTPSTGAEPATSTNR